jgi:pimeloyl-ACP methyl ester carboxylesterase
MANISIDRRGLFTGGVAGAATVALAACASSGSGTPRGAANAANALRSSRSATQERYVTGAPLPHLAVPEVQAPGGTLEVDGARLWYWDTGGQGQPIVLLHPATGSGRVWGYQQRPLAEAGYRIIGYSRRGHSGSTSGDPDRPGTGAGDLLRLLRHLDLGRVHLVGSAAGGFVAAALAQAHPEMVATLTIACSIVAVRDPVVRELVPWLYEPWWNELGHDLRELSPSYRAMNRAGHARWNELYAASRGDNPPINQPAGETMMLADLGALRMPALLISGDADLLAPPPVARAMAAAMPQAELAILTECGHSAYWERPAEFNAVLLDFIGRSAA